MQLGKRLRQGTRDRLASAVELNPQLIVAEDKLSEATGFTEEYFEAFGLTRTDLKRLETYGFAKRGYFPRRGGHQLRWVLIGDANGRDTEGNTAAETQTNDAGDNSTPESGIDGGPEPTSQA